MLDKIKSVAKKVEIILKHNPSARDDDALLYVLVCGAHENPHAMSILYNCLSDTPFESVRRARQKAQAENENLRGKKYIARHFAASKIRKEIKK